MALQLAAIDEKATYTVQGSGRTAGVDRKIVQHLKRKLTYRIDKRLHSIYETERQRYGRAEITDGRAEMARERKSTKHLVADSKTVADDNASDDAGSKIFGRYDEFGQRTTPPRPLRSVSSISSLPHIYQRESLRAQTAPGTTEADGLRGRSSSTGQDLGLTEFAEIKADDCVPDVDAHEGLVHQDAAEPDERVEPDEAAAGHERSGAATRFDPPSPVPTPHIATRPATRGSRRVSAAAEAAATSNGVDALLAGDLTARCPPDMLASRIYVACSGQDTRTEQKQFVQALYPQLKATCSALSCELQIIDMHWAMAEACIDNHSYASSCYRALASTSSCPGSLLVVFTSGKYGDCFPPVTLPPSEFEALYKSMERAHTVLLDEIESVRQRLRHEEEAEKASSSQKTLGEQLADEEEEEPDSKAGAKQQKLKHATQSIMNLLSLKERDATAVKPSILGSWYKLDENSVPPAYRLQRVSTQYPDFVKADATRRRAARAAWVDTSSLLRATLLEHCKTAAIPKGTISKAASTSLLEEEIGASLASSESGQSVMLWYSKLFDGMNADDKASQDFAENRPELRAKIRQLEETIRESSLPASCVNETMLEWTDEGFAPDRLRSHQLYLERMCAHFAAQIERRLVPRIHEAAAAMPADRLRRALYVDASQHAKFCRTRAMEFHGRKTLLAEVKKYLRTDTRVPLIIHGHSGNGRKSFICRAAWESRKWCRANRLAVIFRTCCIGGESTNLRSLLYSLCCQICEIYGQDLSSVPTDFKGLVNDFTDRMKLATTDRGLLIVLDSLECLSDENDARKLAWLPKETPQHVHMLLSALTEEKHGPLETMKRLWADGMRSTLAIGDLPPDDAVAIFNHWMAAAERRLTADQRTTVLDAVAQCPSPLYLRVVFGECLHWPSYATAEQTKLPIGVKRVVTIMLGRLERDHGDAVVRRALGYITAAKVGIARNELEDLLSLDEAAMDELNAHLQLPLRRCPPAVVERLLQDLADIYLVERASGGRRVVQWAHQQFREVAVERYLLQRDKAPSYHKALSEYFMGLWSDGRRKPVGISEETADRYVASQRLAFQPTIDDHGSSSSSSSGGSSSSGQPSHQPLGGSGGSASGSLVYNLRKLDELPYHLMGSQQFDALKSECLCNYEWMLAKLCGLSFRALLDDYQLALAAEPRDRDLNLLLETLMLSRAVLERDPRQLGSQLMGRLGSIIHRDTQLPPQEPRQYVACHPLLTQVERSSVPTFLPSVTCLTPPGAALADVLQGHQDELTAMALTEDGTRAVTASRDDTIKTWDLRSGKVLSTLPGVGKDVLELVLTGSDRLAVTSELRCLRFWDLAEGRCTQTVSDFHDYATLSATKDGRTVAAYFVGRNFMRSWNVNGSSTSPLCESQLEERAAADREKPILVSKTSVGDLVLVTHQDSGQASTQNIRTGAVVHTLKCVDPSARIVALAISNDYFVLANRFRLSKQEEPFALDLFSNQSGAFVRSVRGCCEDNVASVEVSSSGTHAICLSTSRQTWTADLAVWNLETEEHKHLSSHAGLGTLLAVNDLRYVLSACRGEPGARVWNISGAIIKPAAKAKQVTGVATMAPMKRYPQRVVVTSSDNSQISVWNMSKDKWSSGMPVRIEHGQIDLHDVVVVNSTKAVILGDRGISSVSKESIFQTIYIYDLENMCYDRKISGVYIIPSPPREYVLIGDDYLLGLSENRSHFMVWNISQGVLSHRIKPAFVTKAETTQQLNAAAAHLARKRNATAKMTPWDRRAETESAKAGRRGMQVEQELRRMDERKREKENAIEQFLMSGNGKVIVASYFAHHLCVFDVERRDHVQTLEDDASVLHLYAAALTHDGSYLALSNYDEERKTSYVTLWDCFGGEVRKRLRNERDVRAVGISGDGRRVVIGKGEGELRVWQPAEKGSVRKLTPYPGFRFLPSGGNKAFVLRGGSIALVYAGDVSAWDLDAGVSLAVYTPDTKISSLVAAFDGRLISFGLCDSTSAVALRLMCRSDESDEAVPRNMLGELPDDSDAD